MARPGAGLRATLLVAATALACAGTPSAGPAPPEPQVTPEAQLAWALALLDDGSYAAAAAELAHIARAGTRHPATLHAILAAAALELDPRNPFGHPDSAATLVARYRRQPDSPAWTDPVAETLYLLSLELGASPPDGGEEADNSPTLLGRPLPPAPEQTLYARLRALEARADSLAGELDRTRDSLAVRERELDRIRRTLEAR